MPSNISNIFTAIPDALPDELFESILKNETVQIERIVSRGHITSAGYWYDQSWDEWVLLLQGGATLCYEGVVDPVVLKPGDYSLIPAHTRHRVSWTDPTQNTIWLAIHINRGV
ncbi:MAG: cupin domain-containing protein [Gammaproteobacteria bacterium]